MQRVQLGSRPRIGASRETARSGGLRALLDSTAPLIAGLSALGLYLATLAPDLTWANWSSDGGELISAAVTLGVPHPPGYPLYVLAGKLFSALPIGTVAFRFNLLSAVSMSLATFFLALTGMRMSHRPGVASVAALLFALTPLVWGQALVAEVYALNAALVAAALFLLLTTTRSGWAGLLLGFAVLGHSTSLLLLPLALYSTPRARWPRLLGGVAVGIVPALLLPLFAAGMSPVVWGDFSSAAGWWTHVSAAIYRPNLGHWPGAAHWEGLRYDLAASLSTLLLGGVLLVIGRLTRPSHPLPARRDMMPLLGTAALYGLLVLAYDTPDAAVLLIPAFMLLALTLAVALPPIGPVALGAPLLLAALSFGRVDLSREEMVRPAAESLLAGAPVAAVILTPGDRTLFTLWYFHHVEGQRPDLILVDQNLFAFDWYRERLARLNPALIVPEADELEAFRTANKAYRPVCDSSLQQAGHALPSLTCTD